MNDTHVVIGAGYGDEGKGLATDFLSAQAGGDALVVRFNGGAQAGHTVVTPDGRRHVFSHIGSGAFAGAPTYLSRFFVSHPILFLREIDQLAQLGVHPRVLVDPDSPVTTPYEMMINQALEASRGALRHGSCGLGFGETLEREEVLRSPLRVRHLDHPGALAERLRALRAGPVRERLRTLGLEAPAHLHDNAVLERFVDDALAYRERIELAPLGRIARTVSRVIFEGAQGLLLDMDYGRFPHVTRSNTGLTNAVALAGAARIRRPRPCYVTRAYRTRHGAGPLPFELQGAPYLDIADATNRPKPWQGSCASPTSTCAASPLPSGPTSPARGAALSARPT